LSGGIQSNLKLKRAKSSGAKDRTVLSMYTKLTELTSLLAELVEIQELTDTIILQVRSKNCNICYSSISYLRVYGTYCNF